MHACMNVYVYMCVYTLVCVLVCVCVRVRIVCVCGTLTGCCSILAAACPANLTPSTPPVQSDKEMSRL